MSSPDSTYFINTKISDNFSISCSHTKTSIYVYGYLLHANQPIYNIPIHKLAATCLIVWRDGNESSSNTCLAIAGRRIVCGVGLVVLSLIGLVDAVIRIALSILTSPFPQIQSKNLLRVGFDGLIYSVGFATYFQLHNVFSEKLMYKLGRPT